MEAPTAAPDITALRACWHPVAFAAELEDKPIARKLLDEPLALYRDSSGTARAVSDLCIHRGTAISLGWIDGDRSSARTTAGTTERTAPAPSSRSSPTRPGSRRRPGSARSSASRATA